MSTHNAGIPLPSIVKLYLVGHEYNIIYYFINIKSIEIFALVLFRLLKACFLFYEEAASQDFKL